MPYWTQGIVTFHASEKRISINPTADYEVTHEKIKYILFIDTAVHDGLRIFKTDATFHIKETSLVPLLIQAAFNNVSLRIGIDDHTDVSDVIIPARS